MAGQPRRTDAPRGFIEGAKKFPLTAPLKAGQSDDLPRAKLDGLRRPGRVYPDQCFAPRHRAGCPVKPFELLAGFTGHCRDHLRQADRAVHGFGCQNAVAQDKNARGDCGDFLELVTDENDRHAGGGAALMKRASCSLRRSVQRGGGFVENQDSEKRIAGRAGDFDSFAAAARSVPIPAGEHQCRCPERSTGASRAMRS